MFPPVVLTIKVCFFPLTWIMNILQSRVTVPPVVPMTTELLTFVVSNLVVCCLLAAVAGTGRREPPPDGGLSLEPPTRNKTENTTFQFGSQFWEQIGSDLQRFTTTSNGQTGQQTFWTVHNSSPLLSLTCLENKNTQN